MSESPSKLSKAKKFSVGNYRVEPSTLRVTGDGQAVRLEPKAMQVLVYFAEHAGQVISRAELEEQIWQGRVVTDDALTNVIAKLRRAFNDDAHHPGVIETIPKTGYRLIADVNFTKPSRTGPDQTRVGNRHWLRILVLAMVLAGMVGWLIVQQQHPSDPEVTVRQAEPAEKPSLVVLPFENLGQSPEQDYFANGVTADLITDLSKVSDLLVIAPGSVFSYKNSNVGAHQISQELNADFIVSGSVQRQEDRVRVNTQLIEASSGRALWAERYESELSDVFSVQDKVATALVTVLKIKLAPSEQGIFRIHPTDSVQAYDAYLRGLEDHGHRTPEGNRSARAFFERAIELDPSFSRAVAGLALVYSREAIDGWTATPSLSLDRAAELAETAASMNPDIPQGHFVRGQVALFRQQYESAIEATQQAIRISPNYADAYALMAWILNYAGQPDEALEKLDIAMRLNPVIPASYSVALGEIEYLKGDFAGAVAAFERALEINPLLMRARMWLAATLSRIGEMEEAHWQVVELTMLIPNFSLARLEYTFPFRDQRVQERLLGDLKQAGIE